VDVVVAWMVFPVALLLLCAGWGGVIGRISGGLPGVLLLPTGFAAIVVVAGIVTTFPALARLAVPAVAGGAAAGLALAWPWRLPARAAAWPAAAATLVFAAYAAPIVLSGEATFAGFITLDDTATFFAMTERMLDEGRTVDGLAPSTYEATLSYALMAGYPLGSLLPLGVGARLVDEDLAWVFQPYLAVIAALLALVLWRLLATAIATRWQRLVAVAVAAQPAILYAYGLWTGVKELVGALLVALAAALAFERRGDETIRGWVPLATAVAATVGALSMGGVVWLVPLAVWLLLESRASLRLRNVAVAAAVLVVLALPAVATAARILGDGYRASWAREDDLLGNLVRPLEVIQVFGIWPAGDFRLRPERYGPTLVLIALMAALALAGLVRSWQRRDGLVPYAACAVFGGLVYWALAGPWIEAKAFAIAAPALLALAASGCAWLASSGRAVEAGVAAAFVAGGVLWSNAYAYGNVNLAPREQLAELERIGRDFAGDGPALMTEYLPVGARHFLRKLDAEGASELRRHVVPLRDGSSLPKLRYANLDTFRLDGLLFYRTLVLRRSPLESRPPAPYELVWDGRWYEVWKRPDSHREVAAHLPLGDSSGPAAVPSCTDMQRLATSGSTLAAVPRANPVAVAAPAGPVRFDVSRRGRYSVWLGGSTRDNVDVIVDGRPVGRARPHLNNLGQFVELASAVLSRGTHSLQLRFTRRHLEPGAGGQRYGTGPLVIAPAEAARDVEVVATADARRLCGRKLHWVEAVG
jgi:hypothetical protein